MILSPAELATLTSRQKRTAQMQKLSKDKIMIWVVDHTTPEGAKMRLRMPCLPGQLTWIDMGKLANDMLQKGHTITRIELLPQVVLHTSLNHAKEA